MDALFIFSKKFITNNLPKSFDIYYNLLTTYMISEDA